MRFNEIIYNFIRKRIYVIYMLHYILISFGYYGYFVMVTVLQINFFFLLTIVSTPNSRKLVFFYLMKFFL